VKKGGTAGFTPALSDETERAGVFLLHRDFFGIFCNKNALHENAWFAERELAAGDIACGE